MWMVCLVVVMCVDGVSLVVVMCVDGVSGGGDVCGWCVWW